MVSSSWSIVDLLMDPLAFHGLRRLELVDARDETHEKHYRGGPA